MFAAAAVRAAASAALPRGVGRPPPPLTHRTGLRRAHTGISASVTAYLPGIKASRVLTRVPVCTVAAAASAALSRGVGRPPPPLTHRTGLRRAHTGIPPWPTARLSGIKASHVLTRTRTFALTHRTGVRRAHTDIPPWVAAYLPGWALEIVSESPRFYGYLLGVLGVCVGLCLLPSASSSTHAGGHGSTHAKPSTAHKPAEPIPKTPTPQAVAAPAAPAAGTAAGGEAAAATTAEAAAETATVAAATVAEQTVAGETVAGETVAGETVAAETVATAPPAGEAEPLTLAPAVESALQPLDTEGGSGGSGITPKGPVLRLSEEAGLDAFSDGSAVWLRKSKGKRQPLFCKLTEDGAVPEVLGASADGSYVFGTSPAGHLVAVSVSNAELTDLTPYNKKMQIGPLFVGSGGQLVQVAGMAPGAPALYRASPPEPFLVLDTNAPSLPGYSLESWLVDSAGPTARAAVMRKDADGSFSLVMREEVEPRVGGAKWNATCERLGLPLPPVDPAGPKLYSPWNEVARWAGDAKVTVLGYQGGNVWLHDGEGGSALAVMASGEHFEMPLRE